MGMLRFPMQFLQIMSKTHAHIPLTAVHPQGDFVLLYANEFVAFSEIFYNIYGSVNCSHPIAPSTPKFLKKENDCRFHVCFFPL